MPDERCLETIMALPARGRNRLSDAGAGRSEQSARVRHHLSLALEDEHCLCLPKLQPSCFVDLAIMVGDVSAAVLEEKEVDSFVKAHPLRVSVGTHIPVLDLVEQRYDLRVDASLLTDLAYGCLRRGFSLVYNALRKLPPPLRTNAHEGDRDFLSVAGAPVHDAARGYLLNRRQASAGHDR